jgi:iron complex outermembrane receptor protein
MPAGADEAPLEEIVVTGTRITRPDFVSASPIVTVPSQTFERVGSSDVEDALNMMPQFVPANTGTSNGFGDGQANLDLRGLGSIRTLVLVDGRRVVGADSYGVPDVNVIPPALIERVEIVTGGASAVYGSDAIAGVVNFRLRRSFEGVQVDGRWGQSGDGDADEYDVSLTAGTSFAGGRGNLMGFVGYADRSQVNQGDRKFSRTSLYYLGPGYGSTGPRKAYVPVGSNATEEGTAVGIDASQEAFDQLFESYGYPAGSVPLQSQFGFNPDGTLFTMGTFDPGSVANFRGPGDPLMTESGLRYAYNTATTVALQMPLDRWSAFGRGSFEINEHAEVYAQILYADYAVNTQFAPTPLQAVWMPVTNPFIPADLATLLATRPDPEEPFRFWKRMSAIGPRVYEHTYNMYQATAGLHGRAIGEFQYDIYAQFGANDHNTTQTGNVLRSKVMELTFAPDGGVATCGGFNPFGVGSVSQGCARYVSVDANIHARNDQTIVEATISGPLLELPAGDLKAAFGLMYRDEHYQYRADNELTDTLPDGLPDVVGIDIAERLDAGDHNVDVYTEVSVPLLRDVTGAQSLDTVFGYRYSDYASSGGVSTWKAELVYEPIETVRVRGSYQRAVRAPSIDELYYPQLNGEGYFDGGEPCSEGSPQRSGPDAASVEALCLAQGVPAEVLSTFYSDTIPIVYGGNPDLRPERANTYTAGVVLQPRFDSVALNDLQISVDWYDIRIDNSILTLSATDSVANCFDARYNPGYRADNFWCAQFSRDATTGEITGATELYRNVAALGTSGIDTQIDWSFPAGPGTVSATWLIAWVDSYELRAAPGVPALQNAGTVGGFAGSYPEWKWNLRVGYSVAGFTAGIRWRYIDSMKDGDRTAGFDLQPTNVSVPAYNYIDLDLRYEFPAGVFEGLVLAGGVENLTDRDPPIFPSYPMANTDPSQYDVLGRRYFLSLSYAF